MNIGSIAKNAAGHLVGRVSTLTVELTIALRPVHSANPNAPKFEVMALSAARAWVRVGALFELASRESGLIFYNGKIEDPSFAQPLYVSLFQQQDGSYNVVWSRPSRRRELPAEIAMPADEGLPPLPGDDAAQAGQREPEGLGASTAGDDFGGDDAQAPAQGRRGRRQRAVETAD
ncbi:DUF736 domain-containing protein [Novosphingobium sp. YAF33]|uniref:DUF736 domain-containing protein n=1 Tax=Novosphingobium sp. YAF33 TaxID=3233082 RepID=UPI003F9649CE